MITWNANESKERLPRALLLCRADFCPGEFWGAQSDSDLLDPRSPRRQGLRCQAQECSTVHGGKCFTWFQKQLCEQTQSRYDQRTVKEGSQRGFWPSSHRVVVLIWDLFKRRGGWQEGSIPSQQTRQAPKTGIFITCFCVFNAKRQVIPWLLYPHTYPQNQEWAVVILLRKYLLHFQVKKIKRKE